MATKPTKAASLCPCGLPRQRLTEVCHYPASSGKWFQPAVQHCLQAEVVKPLPTYAECLASEDDETEDATELAAIFSNARVRLEQVIRLSSMSRSALQGYVKTEICFLLSDQCKVSCAPRQHHPFCSYSLLPRMLPVMTLLLSAVYWRIIHGEMGHILANPVGLPACPFWAAVWHAGQRCWADMVLTRRQLTEEQRMAPASALTSSQHAGASSLTLQ